MVGWGFDGGLVKVMRPLEKICNSADKTWSSLPQKFLAILVVRKGRRVGAG
jgi:hypothetical protein